MKFTQENRTVIIVATFAAVALLIILAVIWPTVSYVRGLSQGTTAIRVYLEKKYLSVGKIRSSLQKMDQIKTEIAAYPEYVFTKGNELSLITNLENIAAKNNITQKIDNSNLDKMSNQQLSLTVSASGSYRNIIKYLADLEALKFFLNVDELQLTPAVSNFQPDNSSAAIRLVLTLYVKNPKK